MLERRTLVQGADPPLSLADMRAAVERSPMWRGAQVKLIFESHEVKYGLEKLRGENR